ncbi:MAG: methylmalonyl Co-A mutase-associated GTPase MeaB [Firmicutes bacterium]|nr:methylmalonyl Co-A mutase-associated GTPase MeaB [Bacillota bacterium]
MTDWRTLARTISRLENGDREIVSELMQLPLTGNAHIIGITGPPGSGKSTMCNNLVSKLAANYRVAAILVDPASPYSGGSILGDRIRMQSLAGMPNVFIRSLSNRGNAGGLNRTIVSVIRLLMKYGFEYILIETIGAGQSEVKIASIADTTMVVAVPNLGDDIQASKAGMMEIADIFIINKADLPGANILDRDISEALPQRDPGWKAPVLQTIANRGEGVTEIITAIQEHGQFLGNNPEILTAKRRRAATFEIKELASWLLLERLESALTPELTDKFLSGKIELSAHLDRACAQLLQRIGEI